MNNLIDQFGRAHEYLRISVTERCNLRCKYCMPPDGIELRPKVEMLTFDEIIMLAEIFVGLGIRKIRITGGEPLVRRGIEQLCETLAQIPGLETLALSTNGILLEEKVSALRNAGVQQVNISLDTLRPERFRQITLRGGFEAVLRGIESTLHVGFSSVKVNTVVMKGFNDNELLDFVEFAQVLSLNLRFIEYMPFLGNRWSEVHFFPYRQMKEIIESKYQLTALPEKNSIHGPAKEFQVAGGSAVIGFIPTMSEHFCASCNRLRLTTDGKLRYCLFAREETDLKRLLRSGARRESIEDAIQAAVQSKWKQHPDAGELLTSQNRAMVAIGG